MEHLEGVRSLFFKLDSIAKGCCSVQLRTDLKVQEVRLKLSDLLTWVKSHPMVDYYSVSKIDGRSAKIQSWMIENILSDLKSQFVLSSFPGSLSSGFWDSEPLEDGSPVNSSDEEVDAEDEQWFSDDDDPPLHPPDPPFGDEELNHLLGDSVVRDFFFNLHR